MRFATILVLAVPLSSCSPEGFEITPCASEGRLAFRIHEIDGWLWDYQPRPSWVLVREAQLQNEKARPIWDARISDLEKSAKRPSRKVVLYGQHLPGWEVDTAPHRLRPGTEYYVHIADTGRSSETHIVAGERLPPC